MPVLLFLSTPSSASVSPFSSVLKLSFFVLFISPSLLLTFVPYSSLFFTPTLRKVPAFAYRRVSTTRVQGMGLIPRNPISQLQCLPPSKCCLFLPLKVFSFGFLFLWIVLFYNLIFIQLSHFCYSIFNPLFFFFCLFIMLSGASVFSNSSENIDNLLFQLSAWILFPVLIFVVCKR